VHRTRAGKTIVVASRWSLQRDQYGAHSSILEINRDITARKQAEAELLRVNERFQLAERAIPAEVWSVTSWKQLREDALDAERSGRVHPDEPQPVSHLRRSLGDKAVPVVAVSDYVSALPDQLARYVGAPVTSLGTDGYGLSDTREELRSFFHTDADGIISAALGLLDGTGGTEPLQAVPNQDRPPLPTLVA